MTHAPTHPARRRGAVRRRGSIYALVLGTVAIAVAMVVGGLELSQIAARAAGVRGDILGARHLAMSAVDQALQVLRSDANWRTTYAAGAVTLPVPSPAKTSMSAVLSDPDGNLGDDLRDDAFLTATGVRGDARQVVRVELCPTPRPCGALYSAIHSGGTIGIGPSILADAKITSAGQVRGFGGSVSAPVQATTIVGGNFLRTTTVGNPGLSMPDATVFATWKARGTAIALPVSKRIEKAVLAPGFSSYGAANARGIYYVDCAGSDVTVRNVRVYGTLVLLNAGPNTTVTQAVVMEAPPGQPALLVQGALDLNVTTANLSELTHLTNFNPIGSGVPGGTNLLPTDTFPSGVCGVVYASGTGMLRGSTKLHGSFIAVTGVGIDDAPTVTHDPSQLDNPPDGFWDKLEVRIRPGSWEQAVD